MPASTARLALFGLALAFSTTGIAEEWPQFRGPTGQGISQATGLPTGWGPEKNILWRTEIPGSGWSSPIVWASQVFLTTAIPGEGEHANDYNLVALCLDLASGRELWRTTVFQQLGDQTESIHGKNSHASPTPITDGQQLYVHFGTNGTACLDLDGKVIWKSKELVYSPQHGNGSSPVLLDKLLVVSCDGADKQFVVAFDRGTGDIVWKQNRPALETKKKFSFCTPLVIDTPAGQQIVSPGTNRVVAYRPADGEELWQFDYEGYSVVPRPVYDGERVFISTSFDQPTLYALELESSRFVKKAWELRKGAPHTPSPLIVGQELYFVSDRGVATCVDAASGETHWVERLGGNYSASPLYAEGRIYFQNEDGGAVVVRAGTEFREVTRNALPGRTLASYAVADSSLLIRTDTALYRIQDRASAAKVSIP